MLNVKVIVTDKYLKGGSYSSWRLVLSGIYCFMLNIKGFRVLVLADLKLEGFQEHMRSGIHFFYVLT